MTTDDQETRDAVFGHPRIGHEGLIDRTKGLEVAVATERSDRLEGDKRLHRKVDTNTKRIDRMVWIAIGAGFGGAAGGGGLIAWLSRMT